MPPKEPLPSEQQKRRLCELMHHVFVELRLLEPVAAHCAAGHLAHVQLRTPGAVQVGLWFAAHEAHGALVGQWMRSSVDYVVVVGPIYSADEQAALTRALLDDTAVLWVVIDAPVAVTFARSQADPGRGLSRDPEFHHAAHRRFRELLPAIPADRTFDSEAMDAEQIAAAIETTIGVR